MALSIRGIKEKLRKILFEKQELPGNPDTPHWRAAQVKLADREKQLREQMKKALGK